MRILVAGSRNFCQSYRVDRALLKASRGHEDPTLVIVTTGLGRTRRGADSIAWEMADQFGWPTERVARVSDAQANLCLAFLSMDDPHDDQSRINSTKAEKVGLPVWRYYQT
jgi:hypothetical protein